MGTVVKARSDDNKDETDKIVPDVIQFTGGLPPFRFEKFKLAVLEDAPPFLRLEATESDLSIFVLEPFVVMEDYAPEVREEDWKDLDLEDQGDVMVLCTVNLTNGVSEATINLAGPIMVNMKNGKAKQIIPLNASKFSPKHRI